MPESSGTIEEIHSSLKASLHRGHQQKQASLDQDVLAASKRVLLEHIAFEPASAPYTMQLDQLRAKYISLNAGAAASAPAGKSLNGGGGDAAQHGGSSNGPTTSPGGSGGDSLPQPKVVLFPEERVKMEWLRQGRIGAGLVNMGNTCFFNSTLQCLTYTAPLVNYCLSNDHKQKCTKNGFCMMCEIQNHIRTSLDCGGKSIKPHSILQKLRCIAKHMKWGRQEDAHEFLRFVVDHLQQACLNGHAKLDRFSKETTVINQIFGGYLQSQVTCLRCQAKSNTFDPFMDLSLDIKGVNTVEEALLKFVKPETLDQDNAYKCPKCKHKVRAQKRFTIYKAPNVLTLQLNRFDINRHFLGKINRFIRYTEKINLRNYMSHRQGEPILYHLYGVLVHSGHSSDCGHYYSFVKSPSKIWYCMNDSMVHQAGNNAVFSADAYVLFYARTNKSSSTGSKNGTPAAGSTNHTGKGLFTPTKAPFIGPVIPSHMKQPSPQMANGLHGTPSSEQGTPIQRQQTTTMLPRTLQTGPSVSRPGNGSTTAPTPQATAASALPGGHGHISFNILSHQQKRQQQQQQQQNQMGEDEKRIVLHIKHGNSTTMEKSPDGKSSKLGNGNGSAGARTTSDSQKGKEVKPRGLVPYYDDDDDSGSDADNQRVPALTKGSSVAGGSDQRRQPWPSLTAGGDSSTSGLKSGKASQQPASSRPTHPPSQGAGGDAQNSHRPHGSPSSLTPRPMSKTGAPLAASFAAARSMSSSPLPTLSSRKVAEEDRKSLLSRRRSASPSASLRLASSGKASGEVVPLELPPVVSVSASPGAGALVRTASGTWHVHPQDTGAPSPRGSCSSVNSVNSTTEWTLHSIDKKEKGSSATAKSEGLDSVKAKLFSPQAKKTKAPEHPANPEKVKSNGDGVRQPKQGPSDRPHSQPSAYRHSHKPEAASALPDPPQSQPSASKHSHKPEAASPLPALVRPDTPVDISDRQGLLSSPHSSQTSEGSRKSRKHKKQKQKHRGREEEEKKEWKRGAELETNGWGKHSRSSSLDSSGKQKKKRRHKREEKRRHRDRSRSDSESEREERHNRGKKRRYSSSDSDGGSSDTGGSRRRRQGARDEHLDGYEWVEVTKESSSSKHKGSSSSKASVQRWNHHVKDDVAPRKDSESKIRSTWDGSRHSKVSANLHGSSHSFGSSVLSWDGSKNQVDRELHAERQASKRDWADDYNQEIDAGKVKKVKQHKFDADFSGGNRFQQYQSDKSRDKHRETNSPWSQDHSYHQRHDHHYHKSWHHKNGGDRHKHFSH